MKAKAAARQRCSTTWAFEKLTDTSTAITDKQAPFGYCHLDTARPCDNFVLSHLKNPDSMHSLFSAHAIKSFIRLLCLIVLLFILNNLFA
jgi:hypothetical protein